MCDPCYSQCCYPIPQNIVYKPQDCCSSSQEHKEYKCPSVRRACSPCPSICPQMSPPSISCNPCPQYCPPCYIPLKRCKSFELRGSILMTQCECVKRNGLQLDCPKKECQGRPCCSTKPFPICCPSKFHWRLANKTMGMKSSPEKVKCKANAKGSGCNPCAVECYPC